MENGAIKRKILAKCWWGKLLTVLKVKKKKSAEQCLQHVIFCIRKGKKNIYDLLTQPEDTVQVLWKSPAKFECGHRNGIKGQCGMNSDKEKVKIAMETL